MQIWVRNGYSGSCDIRQEGLYVHIQAELPRMIKGICRLSVVSEKERFPLGVMLPRGNALYIDTRVPRKRFPEEIVLANAELDGEEFYPVSSENGFAHPEKLENGKYQKRGSVYGIVISNSTGQ